MPTSNDDDSTSDEKGVVEVKKRTSTASKSSAKSSKAGPKKAAAKKAGPKPSATKKPAQQQAEPASSTDAGPRQITLSVRTLVFGVLGTLAVIGLLFGVVDNLRVRSQLHKVESQRDNSAKAEQVSGDYAVRAATLNYKDLTPWAANLKKGVSPELAKQFDVAVPAMQQVLTPVRMTATAKLVSAKTTDIAGDIYKVTAVVEVDSTSLQAPNGATSLAAYVLTLNKAQNWMITAVGDQAAPGSPKLPGLPGAQSGRTTSPRSTAPSSSTAPGATTTTPTGTTPSSVAPNSGG
ncbi:MAG: hypothetical protein QM728_12155 [Gordonia sp. (in: high G+C Gram-positive bacteria)]|uniref:hypothetical protein n=1 Tax=Gordonia sp. (in: high G+C Gram-positive bacteria) TaxID=84139 RepID=UPI0039E40A45